MLCFSSQVFRGKGKKWPIPGDVVKNNVFGIKVQQVLADPYNKDFRPLPGTKVCLIETDDSQFLEIFL